jgi:RNA polymerase sigma factor (sigma-70 family)
VSCEHEHGAFIRHLFERYRAPLLRHVAGLLGVRDDAEDVVQETYARMLKVRDLEPSETQARSYMFRVATNLAYDRHRRRRESSLEDIGAVGEVRDGDAPGLDAIVDVEQALDTIAKTLLQLKPRCRQVFLLRAAEGLSYEAIAERLAVSKRTVEREMSHALEVCQRRLRRLDE